LQHAPSLAHALSFSCELKILRGDVAAVSKAATELLELSEQYGLLQHRAGALMFLGWVQAHSGEIEKGTAKLEEGLNICSAIGFRMYFTRALYLRAECQLLAGRHDDGLEAVTRALDSAAETGVECYVPLLHRTRAKLLLQGRPRNDAAAEASLRDAIALAQQQGGKGWELASATSLARLWRDQGRHAEARDLLVPIFSWFTEGFDAPDLAEAKALLDELGIGH
jgi:predicted ATPase